MHTKAHHSRDRRQAQYRGYGIEMERRDLCWLVRMQPSSPKLPLVQQHSFKTATQSHEKPSPRQSLGLIVP
jgi:hypothetical protein